MFSLGLKKVFLEGYFFINLANYYFSMPGPTWDNNTLLIYRDYYCNNYKFIVGEGNASSHLEYGVLKTSNKQR